MEKRQMFGALRATTLAALCAGGLVIGVAGCGGEAGSGDAAPEGGTEAGGDKSCGGDKDAGGGGDGEKSCG